MIYFQINQIKNRKISKRFKSKSKSNKNDLNRDLNHARFKSPMILTALPIPNSINSTADRLNT
jgi:hypothetical protein